MIREFILLIATSASQLLVIDDRLSEETKQLAQPYWDCVINAAIDLEKSHSSAEEIYVASRYKCDEQFLDLQAAIDVDLIMGEGRERRSEDILVHLHSELRSAVYYEIVSKRANNAPNN